jgi:hypothetical protein
MLLKNRKCFDCKKELKEFGGVFMLGLDRPYVNLWFHRACLDKVDDLLTYLNEKIDEIEQEMPNFS